MTTDRKQLRAYLKEITGMETLSNYGIADGTTIYCSNDELEAYAAKFALLGCEIDRDIYHGDVLVPMVVYTIPLNNVFREHVANIYKERIIIFQLYGGD